MDTHFPTDPLIDHKIEELVLGSMIIDVKGIDAVIDSGVEEKHFHLTRNRFLYKKIKELYLAGEVVDLISLSMALKGTKHEDAMPEIAYMLSGVSSHAQAEHHSNMLIRIATLREIRNFSSSISSRCNGTENPEEILKDMENQAFNILSSKVKSTDTSIKSALPSYIDRLQQRIEGVKFHIETGIKALDDIIVGFYEGTFNIIAARPSMGKSTLLLNLVYNMSSRGIPCGIISLEDPPNRMIDRLVRLHSGVNMLRIDKGTATEEEIAQVCNAISYISNLPIEIAPNGIRTPSAICRLTKKWLSRPNPVKILFIDYLQLLHADNSKTYRGNRNGEVSSITNELANLAREVEIPIVILSQLSRASEARQDKRPMLSDLRDSGSIEQDADTVTFIYREAVYNKTADKEKMELGIKKNRSGMANVTAHVRGNLAKGLITDLTWRH